MVERERETIGLIGAGLLGSAIAERLLASGFDVLGFDRDPAALDRLRASGGSAAAGSGEVARRCRRIVLSLPDGVAVGEVLRGIEDLLRPEGVVLDTTTGGPGTAEEWGTRLEARGVAYVDGAVCGSSAELRRGEVVVVAGGPPAAFEACRDILAAFARGSRLLGGWGAGARMKLVTNLVLGLHRAVLAEALSFAGALGLDPAEALAVLKETSSRSGVMDAKGPKMLERDFAPQARLSQHAKDVRLILEAGAAAGAKLPLSELHRRLLERAEEAGLGALDNSAIVELFRAS